MACTATGLGTPAAFDLNTACTSFLYGLSTATALIRTGVVGNALVIGAELISPFMDWSDRDVAVLFGDGAAAVVLQATSEEEGLLSEKLGCYADARETLTDAIQVACPGVSPGESGGPAVDSAGKVVGVIEGSGSGIATLTPVTDLTSPH